MLKQFCYAYAFLLCLCVFAMLPAIAYGQDEDEEVVKVVDLLDDVYDVKQDYDFRCVYACLEANHNSKGQCEFAGIYIDDYIVDYYNGGMNPYSLLMDGMTFSQTMLGFTDNIHSPCTDGPLYEYFGTIQSDLDHFIGQGLTFYDVVEAIAYPHAIINDPIFCVEVDGGTGHCVLYIGSTVYNEDLDDLRNEIRIMDPYYGYELTMYVDEFAYTYSHFYSEG